MKSEAGPVEPDQSMPRLLIHLEGPTEEQFVNQVLRSYLLTRGYQMVGARILGRARQRERRGGIRSWPSVRKDIVNHLREDPGCIATTMVDFYGLPQDGDRAWPGRSDPSGATSSERAAHVERALLADIILEMGDGFDPNRFIPFVVVHEFEGLLFSDCAGFSRGVGRVELQAPFQAIRDLFPTPEDINDSPDTAPSKRVRDLFPGYQKPLLGLQAAQEIGLDCIRNECPHFNRWIERLESRIP